MCVIDIIHVRDIRTCGIAYSGSVFFSLSSTSVAVILELLSNTTNANKAYNKINKIITFASPLGIDRLEDHFILCYRIVSCIIYLCIYYTKLIYGQTNNKDNTLCRYKQNNII